MQRLSLSQAKLCSLPWKFWTNFVRFALICHSRGRTKFALLRSWKVTVVSLCSYKVLDIFCSFCFYILQLRTKLSSLCLNFVKFWDIYHRFASLLQCFKLICSLRFNLEILRTNMFFRIDNNNKKFETKLVRFVSMSKEHYYRRLHFLAFGSIRYRWH
jgi:hypothetical protein